MEKKTLYALIAVLALGAGALTTLRAPEKGQRSGPPPRPIAAVKAADIVRLELTSEKQSVTVLEKKGDAWRVTSPGDFPADQPQVKSLLDGLEKLSFGDIVTEGTAKLQDFGVADGKGSRIAAKGAQGPLFDLLVGKQEGGFTMVRVVGKTEVWQASGLYPYMVSSKEPNDWREHALVSAAPGDLDKLSIEGPNGKLVLARVKSDDKAKPDTWNIAEAIGEAPKTTEALDGAMPAQAAQAFATLRADGFVDGKKPEEVGLDKPALTITGFVKDRAITLLVGAAAGDKLHVRMADGPQIYTVPKLNLERLGRSAADFRDKTVTRVKEADLAGLEIATGGETLALDHAGEAWTSKAKLPLDDAKVKGVVSSFEALIGSGVSLERAPAKTGLAKPAASVTLRLKDKRQIALKVGALSGDDYYVQKVGSPDVLLVKKYQVERFMKKPGDLKK